MGSQAELGQVSHWVIFFKLQLKTLLVSFFWKESGEHRTTPPHRVVRKAVEGSRARSPVTWRSPLARGRTPRTARTEYRRLHA